MEAVRTSETSVDNYFTRQYIPEDNSEHHTRHRENLKSHNQTCGLSQFFKTFHERELWLELLKTPAHYVKALQTCMYLATWLFVH
jgi:hypothetical protein